MTKKYAAVYPPLVERLLTEEGHRKGHRKGPDRIKAVKTKLHQLYGAYTQDNAHKKAAAIIRKLEEQGTDLEQSDGAATAKSLLALHASTKERLPFYAEFYDFILQHTGPVESVLDIGCGYNPFSIPLIQAASASNSQCIAAGQPTGPAVAKLQAYYAYDIDTRVADLLNRFFAYMQLPQLARCADLAVHIPTEPADIALMCKLLPVLEAQSPGRGFRLARELNVRHLAITYPLKSLGGREKGMARHYSAAFEKALAEGELGKFAPVAQQQIGPEMLYLLEAAAS